MAQTMEQNLDGTTTEYDDIDVAGEGVQRLLVEIFTDHWAEVFAGPIIEGAAYEIRFPEAPRLSMLDGYLTVDVGAWHFHLCVGDHRGAPGDLARVRRVARAAFFRTEGGSCVPGSWGVRLWNGRGEQMITVFFPNPYLDEQQHRTREPRWEQTRLWQGLRDRYARP
ncbi:MAG: hypothetical protein WED01_14805 [Candidatus Rokuibacteriota bacterium]